MYDVCFSKNKGGVVEITFEKKLFFGVCMCVVVFFPYFFCVDDLLETFLKIFEAETMDGLMNVFACLCIASKEMQEMSPAPNSSGE